MLLSLFTIHSCKDDSKALLNDSFNSLKVSVTVGDSLEINKQLKWIAKGVAGITHQNQNVKSTIHAKVEMTDFNSETNENLQTHLNGLSFNYSSEVANWLQTNIPTNDYDASYFFDIDIDSCLGKTSILIPDAEDIGQSLLHVVTISPEGFDEPQNIMGYYIHPVNNLLDSLWINEDNMDSVYLWVVMVDSDCELGYRAPYKTLNDCDPACNGKDCRPWCLNTPDNCSACPTPEPLSLPTYKLYLRQVDHLTDFKGMSSTHKSKYQENFIKGKYEMRFGYGIYQGSDLDIGFNKFEPQENPTLAQNIQFREDKIKPGKIDPEIVTTGRNLNLGNHPVHKKNGIRRARHHWLTGALQGNKGIDPLTIWSPANKILLYDAFIPGIPVNLNQKEPVYKCAFYLIEYDKKMGFNNKSKREITLPSANQVVNDRKKEFQIFTKRYPYTHVHDQNAGQPFFSDHVHVLPRLNEWTLTSGGSYIYEAVFEEAKLIFELVPN